MSDRCVIASVIDPSDLRDRAPEDTVSVLDEHGNPPSGYEPPVDDETLRSMYADMVTARRFDERAVSLQRQGRIGTYAPLAGQEGSQIGSTYALAADDWISYQYREHGAVVARGFPEEYLLYWMGHEIGNEALADVGVFPLNISIGANVPHAVGLAMAADYLGDDRISVVHFGDGATSQGDVHEGMNFAGVFDAPVVFFCNNNQWAISVPRERQTASATIAGKAHAYGFAGVRVDGMDPLAVYEVTAAAAEKARSGGIVDESIGRAGRPTMIEAIQYRFGAHTTADDPTAYRDDEEVDAWKRLDPIDRFEGFLLETGRIDDEGVDAVEAEADERIEAVVEFAEGHEPDPDDLFEDAYDELPPRLCDQRASLRELRDRHGDAALIEDD